MEQNFNQNHQNNVFSSNLNPTPMNQGGITNFSVKYPSDLEKQQQFLSSTNQIQYPQNQPNLKLPFSQTGSPRVIEDIAPFPYIPLKEPNNHH